MPGLELNRRPSRSANEIAAEQFRVEGGLNNLILDLLGNGYRNRRRARYHVRFLSRNFHPQDPLHKENNELHNRNEVADEQVWAGAPGKREIVNVELEHQLRAPLLLQQLHQVQEEKAEFERGKASASCDATRS